METQDLNTAEETSSEQSSNLQSKQEETEVVSDSKDPIFEEVDFSELTALSESDDGDFPIDAPEVEVQAQTTDESPSEELATEEEQSEDDPITEVNEAEEPIEVEAAEEVKPETPEEPVQVAEQPEVTIPTQEQLEGMYKEHREQTIPIFQDMFQLTEEEAAALDEQPSKVLPKLAGQLMYDTMLSTYNACMNAMPSVVNRMMAVSEVSKNAEKTFYDRWPDLNKNEIKPIVATAIQAYRASNPRATLEDVVEKAGVMAMINAGLNPSATGKAEEKKAPAAVKKPARPVGAGRSTQPAPPQKPESLNEFAELAEAFIQEHS